jgi:hypothetical protein
MSSFILSSLDIFNLSEATRKSASNGRQHSVGLYPTVLSLTLFSFSASGLQYFNTLFILLGITALVSPRNYCDEDWVPADLNTEQKLSSQNYAHNLIPRHQAVNHLLLQSMKNLVSNVIEANSLLSASGCRPSRLHPDA